MFVFFLSIFKTFSLWKKQTLSRHLQKPHWQRWCNNSHKTKQTRRLLSDYKDSCVVRWGSAPFHTCHHTTTNIGNVYRKCTVCHMAVFSAGHCNLGQISVSVGLVKVWLSTARGGHGGTRSRWWQLPDPTLGSCTSGRLVYFSREQLSTEPQKPRRACMSPQTHTHMDGRWQRRFTWTAHVIISESGGYNKTQQKDSAKLLMTDAAMLCNFTMDLKETNYCCNELKFKTAASFCMIHWKSVINGVLWQFSKSQRDIVR